jgi:hypothetical protein
MSCSSLGAVRRLEINGLTTRYGNRRGVDDEGAEARLLPSVDFPIASAEGSCARHRRKGGPGWTGARAGRRRIIAGCYDHALYALHAAFLQ